MSQPLGRDRRQLRNILINPRYQTRFILWAALSGLFVIAYFGMLLLQSFRQYQETAMARASIPLRELLNEEYTAVVLQLLTGSLIIFITAMIVGIFLSHRTAGPMHQLKLAFNRVRSGKWNTRVVFRDADEFQDLGDRFNKMMETLEERSKSR
jgi:nitrogen fixation/metabolism regulation signal transduction histidine kinase